MTTQRDYFFSLQHSWLFLNNLLNYYCYNIDLLYTQQIYTVLREVMGSLSGNLHTWGRWRVVNSRQSHASGRGGGGVRLVIIMSTILTTRPRAQAPLLRELVLSLWCFSPLSFISWRSILLVEETGVHREYHWPAASHWQTFLHNFVSSTSRNGLDFCKSHHVSNDKDITQVCYGFVVTLSYPLYITILRYFIDIRTMKLSESRNLVGNMLLCEYIY